MSASYQYQHVIPSFYAGARCRTCAQVLSVGDNFPERFCAAHDKQVRSYEARLGQSCCKAQDEFEKTREKRWIDEGKPLPSLGGATTASYNILWQKAILLTEQCETSLVELESVMEFMLQSTHFISNVEEFKYSMGKDFYNYVHCAFIITMVNKQVFVFDPTGIQFGPDWAVLTTWEEYEAEFGVLDELVVRPLGRNADYMVKQDWKGDY
jgi:hypothetical protein